MLYQNQELQAYVFVVRLDLFLVALVNTVRWPFDCSGCSERLSQNGGHVRLNSLLPAKPALHTECTPYFGAFGANCKQA